MEEEEETETEEAEGELYDVASQRPAMDNNSTITWQCVSNDGGG